MATRTRAEPKATAPPERLRHLPYPTFKALGEVEGVPAFELGIDGTIPELAYATHSFYRYYGKFPSVLGGCLIDRHGGAGPIFDNFLGSGTTLVEARLRGRPASGVDLNPLAVFASNLKVKRFEEQTALAKGLGRIASDAEREAIAPRLPDWKGLEKWFTAEAATRLGRLKARILREPPGPVRELAVLAFLAVIRRCSNAFDGEVRPHVNRDKKPRDPYAAFRDKSDEVLRSTRELLLLCPAEAETPRAFCGDSLDDLAGYLPYGAPSLTISHPPYLNCFNYYAVFSLENRWSLGFDEVWAGTSEARVREQEFLCWPATDERILRGYFEGLATAYRRLRDAVRPGSKLAIVIGDATIRGELVPVISRLLGLLPACGFVPVELLYRTTHYGIGKYAYMSRADYHGDALKKDGVVVAVAASRAGLPHTVPPERGKLPSSG